MTTKRAHTDTTVAGGQQPQGIGARTGFVTLYFDEDGLSTVEMLLLLFIGLVIILVILKWIFPNIWNRIQAMVNSIAGMGQNDVNNT